MIARINLNLNFIRLCPLLFLSSSPKNEMDFPMLGGGGV